MNWRMDGWSMVDWSMANGRWSMADGLCTYAQIAIDRRSLTIRGRGLPVVLCGAWGGPCSVGNEAETRRKRGGRKGRGEEEEGEGRKCMICSLPRRGEEGIFISFFRFLLFSYASSWIHFQVSRPLDRYGKCHPSSQVCRYTVRRMRTHVAIATIFI